MSWPDPLGLHTTLAVLYYVTNQCPPWTHSAQNSPHLLFWEIGFFFFFLFSFHTSLFFFLQALTFNQTQIPLCLLTYQADTGCCKKLEYRNPEQNITITLPVWSLFSLLRPHVKMLTWQTTKHERGSLSLSPSSTRSPLLIFLECVNYLAVGACERSPNSTETNWESNAKVVLIFHQTIKSI